MKDLRSPLPSLPINLLLKNIEVDLICEDTRSLVDLIADLQSREHNPNIFVNNKQSQSESLKPIKAWNPKSANKKLILLHLKDTELTKQLQVQAEEHNHLLCILNHDELQGTAELPLSFKDGEMEISVHHKGRSDRKARAYLQYLKHKTTYLKDALLVVIGTDHNHLELKDREHYHANGPKYQNILDSLQLISGIQEYFLLNTCNRVEIYAIASSNRSVIELIKKVMNLDHLEDDQFYAKYDRDAFLHLCMVSSGMMAQIPGESHVVQQLKSAFQLALDQNYVGGLLQQIFDNALFVSKFVRNKTIAATASLEIEDIAAIYANKVLNNVTGKNILILGSGVVGKGILERIIAHKPTSVHIFYRSNIPDLSKYADENVAAHTLEQLTSFITDADLIFSAVSSNRFVLHNLHITSFNTHKNTTVIDVCVPRTVDPNLSSQNNITLIDTDILKKWYLGEIKDLDHIKQTALIEIEQRIGRYEKIYDKEWMQE